MRKEMKRLLAILLCLVLGLNLVACSKSEVAEQKPADFGSYGADFARQLAKKYPYRKAYSGTESEAGEMIKKEFESLGYKVETQNFTSIYGSNSANYIIHIEGSGFVEPDGKGGVNEIKKKVVIGAHYDSAFSADEVPEGYTYDGISDNASGVGCLVTIAKEIKNYGDLGFDIDIVAFGAGGDEFRGASQYFDKLSSEEQKQIEVMFCIDSIYAGDKVYASSGLNSLSTDGKYHYKMRRKLYQAYDVAYNDMLSSKNGFNLYYNESNIKMDLNGDGYEDTYREVSLNESDYSVFDSHDVPVVFFDSGDYFFDSIDKVKETKNLNLQEFDGKIAGTLLDSSEVLDEVQNVDDKDILEIRINNVSYCIMGTLQKGSDFGMTHAEYEESLKKIETTEESATSSSVAQK